MVRRRGQIGASKITWTMSVRHWSYAESRRFGGEDIELDRIDCGQAAIIGQIDLGSEPNKFIGCHFELWGQDSN